MKTPEEKVKNLLSIFSFGIEELEIENLHTEFETANHTYEIIVSQK